MEVSRGDIDPQLKRGRPSRLAATTFAVAASASMLLTFAMVLWWRISMDAIVRADDAGWDKSLLLPNQFTLDAAIVGAWALCATATALSFVLMLRSRPRHRPHRQ